MITDQKMRDISMENVTDKAKEKQRLRSLAAAERDAMSEKEHLKKSDLIAGWIMTLPEWEDCKILYTYVSMGNEPYTPALIDAALKAGKRVCVPRIFGKEMRFIEIHSTDDFHPGTWGIMEPDDSGVYEDNPGLVIVPGVVFGEDFVRVGYGAGYYDRFFEGHTQGDGWFLAAVCYEFQMQPTLPAEEFDVYMDAVITEDRVLRR